MDSLDVKQELERFRKDMHYFDEHREALLQQYPERWVAIYHQQVVAVAEDIEGVVRELEDKGIPPGDAFCEYLTDKEELLIL